MTSSIKVRLAPSPTGYLHIGTARTALFNFLFAKQNKGAFLLRIEDTDLSRNTEQAYNSILNGLKMLGLNWDGEVIYQKNQISKHLDYANQLIKNGFAYYCYLTHEEIEERKQKAESEGKKYIHKHNPKDEIPVEGVSPTIRIKVPQNQNITNEDLVQGKVTINSDTIEDFIIVRQNNTPVYMLSVVCDDIDMNITHVIRGDDHLTNTAKQIIIYNGLNAKLPLFAHIPLIHGEDGKKLSKRHGALAVEEYIEMGFLPEALRSYLIRLGWGSENDNILNDLEMLAEFNIKNISKAPSRFNLEKLKNINHHFIQQAESNYIAALVLKNSTFKNTKIIAKAVQKIKYRYSTILEMKNEFLCFEHNFQITEQASSLIQANKHYINLCINFFKTANQKTLEQDFKTFLKEQNIGFGKVGPCLRASLIGKTSSIGIFEIIDILGFEEALQRLENAIKH